MTPAEWQEIVIETDKRIIHNNKSCLVMSGTVTTAPKGAADVTRVHRNSKTVTVTATGYWSFR